MNILIAGCGYTGIRTAKTLHKQGHRVFGLRRTGLAGESFIHSIRGDLTKQAIDPLPDQIDAIILSAGLRRDTEKNYEALFVDGYAWLIDYLKDQGHPLNRMVMISTTSVFAESDGNWVDEFSPVDHEKVPAKYYLAAEEMISRSGIPSTTIRLSGIYGPGRIRIITEVKEGRARRTGSPHYLNHIHAEDAAGAIAHILQHKNPAPLYIGSDREPADRNEVLQWIAGQLELGIIPELENDEEPKRRSGNKRCNPDLLIQSGYSFRFPSFREGYADLLT